MQQVFQFLKDIAANNDREWFAAHREEYNRAHQTFVSHVETLIPLVSAFDPEIAPVKVKDTLYRFYRDTRFSPDKSPYKRHFGTFINAHGKKSFYGGYYIHVQPSACMLGIGSYDIPADALRALRVDVMNKVDTFHAIMEAPGLKALHPVLGMSRLKTMPKGFPRDFSHPEYLRPKDYTLAINLPDEVFLQPNWEVPVAKMLQLTQPFMRFINATLEDYI